MPNWLGNALLATALVVMSVSPKIWLQRHSAQVDGERLNGDIADRLTAIGFRVTLDRDLSVPAVRAERADCRLVARNGDRGRELHDLFNLEQGGHSPVYFGYRGKWAPHPAGARAVLERFGQNGLARVGIDMARPAVIALAAAGPCAGTREALATLHAHAYRKASGAD
ncbi:hypothetical protein [Sphingomonas sp. PR090111-T3T-6A]|uniref:hypothetical protein n=1 Tax=Sphingomonas sp. PR090111-T3T-6A TaxID=685778 RepID=UPI000380D1DB|nr:hypothetical protein [Sphingomonas sp. PR090111-T3T-6A]